MLQHDGEHGSSSGEWQCHQVNFYLGFFGGVVLFFLLYTRRGVGNPNSGSGIRSHTEHAVFPSQSDAVEQR